MSAARDPVTLALTGELPFAVLAGALIALPAAFFLLALYRRAVLRGMKELTGASPPDTLALAAEAPPNCPINFAVLEAAAAPGTAGSGADAWKAAGIYVAAIAVFASVMTAALLLSRRDAETGSVKLAILFWTYFWPAVLAVNLVASTDRGT